MMGLATFGWVTVSVIVFLLLAFASLFVLFVRARGQNPLNTPEKTQALATVLSLLFGTAATAGGAIATIHVASFGLDISERQDRLESTRFIEAKVTRSIDHYSNLLIALSDVYASAVVVDVKMPELDNSRILQIIDQDVPEELSIEMVVLADRLVALNNAIGLMMRDDFSYYCFRRFAKQTNGKLAHLNKALQALGVEESKLTLSVKNMSDIAAIVDVASRRVRAGKYGDLIQARLLVNSSDIHLFGMPYNNRNVRSFMFTGNLIFSMAELEEPGQPSYIASFGAAIFHDLLYSVPNGKRIEECVEKRYPTVFEALPIQEVFFDPDNISADNLLSAIEDVEALGDLYLLKERT